MTRNWIGVTSAFIALFALGACTLEAYIDTSNFGLKLDPNPDPVDSGSPIDAESPIDAGTNPDASTDGGPELPQCGAGALAPSSIAVSFANTVLTRWPNATSIASKDFVYNDGIVLQGIERVYELTGDARYLSYIKTYVDTFVSANGNVDIPSEHDFEKIQPAILLPFLWKETGDNKYKLASEKIRNRFNSIPRGASDGFWHAKIYPNQMWLESVYMGEPFLARYGATFDCGTFCADTIAQQTFLIAQHTQDPLTGLLYHAWDESRKADWANKTTGRSAYVWGRALGWYATSLVDTLRDLPAEHPSRPSLINLFERVASGIKTYQDPATGLWYQVVDKGNQSDNWLETSASGLFVYALKLGVLRGYLDESYLAVAERGWQGLQTKITTDSVGPVINGAVREMDVQDSYSDYVHQNRRSNSPEGLSAVLLAATAMETDCDY